MTCYYPGSAQRKNIADERPVAVRASLARIRRGGGGKGGRMRGWEDAEGTMLRLHGDQRDCLVIGSSSSSPVSRFPSLD